MKLTLNEILNTPAGYELDALIAKGVMGINLSQECEGDIYEEGDHWTCTYCSKVGYWGESFKHTIEPKQYSTDIADAWEVVEKLLPLFRFALAQIDSGTKWFAQFENIEHFGEWKAFEAEEDTAPLAICRAALLANF